VLELKGVTSKRGLATKVGVSPQTAKRLIDGIGRPAPETVAAVADALFAGDRDRVWELAGFAHRDHGDWVLPPEASLLDEEQREAVVAIVRAMLPPAMRRGVDAAEDKADRRARTEPIVEDVLAAQRRQRRGGEVVELDEQAARDVGREGTVSRRRREQDQAGQSTDDPNDMEPR
jgi:hypothetical protein